MGKSRINSEKIARQNKRACQMVVVRTIPKLIEMRGSFRAEDTPWLEARRRELVRIIDDEFKRGFPSVPCYETERGLQDVTRRQAMEDVEGLVFHYTSLETFRKHIYGGDSIRLSPSISFSDPVERMWYLKDGSGEGVPERLAKYVKSACFCKPYMEVSPDIKIPGYALARMWDQYGDCYKGVCLGFHMERLKKEIAEQYGDRYRIDDVRYTINLNPDQFSTTQQFLYDDELSKIIRSKNDSDDVEILLKVFQSKQFDIPYRKAIDYRDENELRLSIFQPDEDYGFLKNIHEALWMVVLGPNVPDAEAKSIVLNTDANVYRLVFNSPYELNVDSVKIGFDKGYARLEILSSSATRCHNMVRKLISMCNHLNPSSQYSSNNGA